MPALIAARRPPLRRALRKLAVPAAVVAVCVAALTPAAPASAAVATVTQLSNWRTHSHWAYPAFAEVARAEPSAHARAVGRLRFLTSDLQAELYLVIASAKLPSGQTWLQVSLPGRPNGQQGWVPATALGALHEVRGYLRIDREGLRATLFQAGRVVFSAPIGVGRPSLPTPAGNFFVVEKLTTGGSPVYGPYALGTSAYAPTLSEWPGGGVVGVHGTNEPQLIPGRPSHGCIRMRNGDITRLWHWVSLGTPIDIV